ncbi:PID-CTERM protein-sorting domain-containing protein [Pedobacter metabolipauper]|uniref:Uncharacterized protein n=1 Tax=Pedobacter metabolipauper TaxID=425513 RepID=A0A4R6SXH0_9SPHI|nr:hypothetical protein [Pedobacter metabolipauper]TDQ10149.1 hypothetical protein ATK78_2314 [Pedobacter metabolipauper]
MKEFILIPAGIFDCIFLLKPVDDPGFPGLDPDVPIDGGLGLLVLAGAIYGVKKIREIKP